MGQLAMDASRALGDGATSLRRPATTRSLDIYRLQQPPDFN
jgi:hypothetical protein